MMDYLPDIFCLIVMASGWYYIFYSPAAQRLLGIEDARLNTFRVRLRRTNGVVMMLLAIALFAACHTVGDRDRRLAAWVFMSIIILLAFMVGFALLDLQLTRKLRERQRKERL